MVKDQKPLNRANAFSILVVGWGASSFERLWSRIGEKSTNSFAHIVHPKYTPDDWPVGDAQEKPYFFFERKQQAMPAPDRKLLASLEQSGVPTINNMIKGDRVVSKLSYTDGLAYATFLAQRLVNLYREIQPTAIIGSFDALHSGIAFATAKQMHIPWYALNFSVIPTRMACFCDRMTPGSRILPREPNVPEQTALAEKTLQEFEGKHISAPAYIEPLRLKFWSKIKGLPQRAWAIYRTLQKSKQREFLRFIEYRSGHQVSAAILVLWRAAAARKALSKVQTISSPPETPYAFFGLHMQPESSIDVWAPFFSNQMWVIELISRSLPPTHRLLVKVHKSDVSNYTRAQLDRMKALPAVELVEPGADARSFIENADLVVAIQGTIGLEGALIGKPVLMLGDSPVTIFPSVSSVGNIEDLPALIKRKLAAPAPSRRDIVDAFATYLAPFMPAAHNDWKRVPDDNDIDSFVHLFDELSRNESDNDKST